MMSRIFIIPVLFCSLLLLSACAGVIAGGAAAVGVAAVKEGGLKTSASDLRIQAEINDFWLRHDIDIFTKLDLTVNQGRVLITGIVQNPEHRVDAVRLAWKVDGVKQVINEIKIANSTGFTGYLSDSWISAQIRTAIVINKDVQNLNYTIDTVDGVVYLMGVAQSREELNRVVETSRTTNGVKRVVSYVKIAGETVSDSSSGSSNSAITAQPSPVIDTDPMVSSAPSGEIAGSAAPVTADPLPLY
jgi:osmotically-inducible protein OsmY